MKTLASNKIKELEKIVKENPLPSVEIIDMMLTRIQEILGDLDYEVGSLKGDVANLDGDIDRAIDEHKEAIIDEVKDAIEGASINIRL